MLPIEHAIVKGCDQRVAMAIQRCLSQITEQHSITSRRYAIATLLKQEVDAEFTRVLTSYKGDWDRELLQGCLPSSAWRQSPPGIKPVQGYTSFGTATNHALQWRARIRLAIHSAYRYTPDPIPKACSTFCSTLDSLMLMIDVISSKEPSHTSGPNGRVYLMPKRRHGEYCELCWRQTEIKSYGDIRDADNRKLSTSRRFCEEHNPQTAPSKYRADLKFKAAFWAEIERIYRLKLAQHTTIIRFAQNNDTPSGYELHLVPVTGHPEDVRRAAYALVHSKLRGTPAQCWIFKKQGLSSLQTAAKLGITDRAVRLALSTFIPKLKQAELIRWGSGPRSKFAVLAARQAAC